MPVWDAAAFARAVRAAASGTDWSARKGGLSSIRDGRAVHVFEFAGFLRFRTKPAEWDHEFWRIMGISFKRKPAPSRHFWGGSCPVPTIADFRLRGDAMAEHAADAVRFAERQTALLPRNRLTLADLETRAMPHERPEDHVITEVVEHICEGRMDAADDVCGAVLSGQRRVGFAINVTRDGRSMSFFELARERMRAGT